MVIDALMIDEEDRDDWEISLGIQSIRLLQINANIKFILSYAINFLNL